MVRHQAPTPCASSSGLHRSRQGRGTERKQYWQGAKRYTEFSRRMQAADTIDFRCDLTERFVSTAQLIELGLVETTPALDGLAARLGAHRSIARLAGRPMIGTWRPSPSSCRAATRAISYGAASPASPPSPCSPRKFLCSTVAPTMASAIGCVPAGPVLSSARYRARQTAPRSAQRSRWPSRHRSSSRCAPAITGCSATIRFAWPPTIILAGFAEHGRTIGEAILAWRVPQVVVARRQ